MKTNGLVTNAVQMRNGDLLDQNISLLPPFAFLEHQETELLGSVQRTCFLLN